METRIFIKGLSALAQIHRLDVFRMLVHKYPGEIPAGKIAAALCVPPSSLSFHLSRLENAGLIVSRREKTNIFYIADIGGIRSLFDFLIEDCCKGHPEMCGILSKIDAGLSTPCCPNEDVATTNN